MSDISNLNIAANEPLDLDAYPVSGGGGSTFPRKGRYTLRAPDTFQDDAFNPNKAGTALTIAIDPTIVGPTGEGRVLKFTKISCKTYPRGKGMASQFGDYLKACGITGRVSGVPEEQKETAKQTAGVVYEANLDWRLYSKAAAADGSDLTIEGMENFPKNEAGEYVPYVTAPTSLITGQPTKVDEEGKAKRLWANLFIPMRDGFVPAGS